MEVPGIAALNVAGAGGYYLDSHGDVQGLVVSET
jgi:hypothetical protein